MEKGDGGEGGRTGFRPMLDWTFYPGEPVNLNLVRETTLPFLLSLVLRRCTHFRTSRMTHRTKQEAALKLVRGSLVGCLVTVNRIQRIED